MNRHSASSPHVFPYDQEEDIPWYKDSYALMRLAVGMILGVWIYCLVIAPLYQEGDYFHIVMHQMFTKGITCSIVITGLCALGMVFGTHSRRSSGYRSRRVEL